MLDVVLVALVIFAAKTSGLATAFTKPGLWFFAASVVLTATASAFVKRADEPAPKAWTTNRLSSAGSHFGVGANQCRYCWIRVVRRPASPYSSIDACQDRNSSVVSL